MGPTGIHKKIKNKKLIIPKPLNTKKIISLEKDIRHHRPIGRKGKIRGEREIAGTQCLKYHEICRRAFVDFNISVFMRAGQI